jgi:hypothetical protein
MNKRARKKLQRAAPGGALMYVPAGMQQTPYGNTFYGNALKNLPVGQTALFSPGANLPPQQGVNPGGLPIAYKYLIAQNTFPPDRSLQQDDIPSFEQLRRLARLDYGINLCERYWLDLVPRMKLKIGLRPEVIAEGAEEKDYQKEISFFTDFFSKPDREHNIHEWIQSALREQSQVDDLYIYKNRTRGGKLLGLRLVAADQMKPLLDDWGYTPLAPKFAYQQYPWGIPGALYTTDMMIHKRETPAVDDPYGMSRVERVILITNLALRKAKMDLAYYTDGNIPAGMMEVPEAVNWTPDQIDAYEQSWNALMAGNVQQMRRIKFTQPGMKYTPFVQPAFDSIFDRYMLNIRASIYGVPMDELGFTDTSNKSVGESQEAMVYRRTIDPFAVIYGNVFSECMATDFEPSMHGDLLCATLSGYEEVEDEQSKAVAITTYTNAGVLGLSAAAKLAGLPEEPGAPQIGRVYMSKDGPVFIDDMAQPNVRKAAQQAQLAGYQMAANPPDPTEQQPGEQQEGKGSAKPPQKPNQNGEQPAQKDDAAKPTMSRVVEALAGVEEQLRILRARNVMEDEQPRAWTRAEIERVLEPYKGRIEDTNVERTQSDTEDETGRADDTGRGTSSDAGAGTQPADIRTQESGQDRREVGAEFRRWREVALKDVKAGKPVRRFVSDVIPEEQQEALRWSLSLCTTPEAVRAVFPVFREQPLERDASPKASASESGGNQPQSKSNWKLRW